MRQRDHIVRNGADRGFELTGAPPVSIALSSGPTKVQERERAVLEIAGGYITSNGRRVERVFRFIEDQAGRITERLFKEGR